MDTGMKSIKVRSKDYLVPDDDHEVYDIFKSGFEKCAFREDARDATFKILFVSPVINKKTVARICRASAHVKLFQGFDYIIEISKDMWDQLNDEQKKILMWHECEHIHVKEKRDGTPTYGLRDHDLKDFRSVVNEHGVYWMLDVLKEE